MAGKKYVDAAKRFDRDQLFTAAEALDLVKSLATAKFDETVELVVRLGVDPRKADQMVRGTVALPSGTGKDVRVAVFAAGAAATEAREAGADIVGADDLAAADREGQHGLRRGHRHARTSCPWSAGSVGCSARVASCPTPRPAPSPTTSARRSPSSRAARSSTAPTATATSTSRIGKVSFDPEALSANFRAVLDELQPGQAGVGQGPVPAQDHAVVHHGPRRQGRHQPPATPTSADGRAPTARPDRAWPKSAVSARLRHRSGDPGSATIDRLLAADLLVRRLGSLDG